MVVADAACRCLRGAGWLLWLAGLLAAGATHAADGAALAAPPLRFDIPAQPLPQALQQYGEITGVAVLSDAGLLGGLRSAAIAGRYHQREALQLMLVGTGLAPRYVDAAAVTLVAADAADASPAPTAPAAGLPAGSDRQRQRAAIILQQSLERALCGTRLTRPGSYRAALAVWPEAGRIARAELLSSSGDARRDAAIVQRVQGLPLAGLPDAVESPATLLLLPRSAGSTPPCRGR